MTSALPPSLPTTEVPLSEAPSSKLLLRATAKVCPLLRVCVQYSLLCVCEHLDGMNAEDKFQVWTTILGVHLTYFSSFLYCQLIHRVVDGVCSRSGPRRTDYGERWSLTEWVELMNTLSSFIRFAVGRGCSDQEASG